MNRLSLKGSVLATSFLRIFNRWPGRGIVDFTKCGRLGHCGPLAPSAMTKSRVEPVEIDCQMLWCCTIPRCYATTSESLKCGNRRTRAEENDVNEMAAKTQDEEVLYKKYAAPEDRPSMALNHCNPVNWESRSFSAPPRLLRNKRILCVDDEIVGTTIRGEILKEHGYAAFLYHCPLAALRCDLFSFDLAILDYQMPGLNGGELLLRMRGLGVRFPIVLLTGCIDAVSHRDRALFSRCIDKGMPIRHLLEVIEALLHSNDASDCGG